MSTRNRWVLIGSIAAVLIVAIVLLWRSRPDTTALHDSAVTAAQPPNAPHVPRDATLRSTASNDSRESVSTALRREYQESPDLYAFAIAAKRRPAEGGYFYALQAVNWCSWNKPATTGLVDDAVAATLGETGTVDRRRSEFIERYRRRCAGFWTLATDAMYLSLVAESKDSGDPLIAARAAVRAAFTTTDHDARARAVQALVDLGDPLLTSQHWLFLARIDAIPSGRRTAWFDGVEFRGDEQSGEYSTALRLASCRPGEPCAEDHTTLLICTLRGVCTDDVEDSVFKFPGTTPEPQRDARIHALIDRMRSAIEARRVDAFRPPTDQR